MGLVAVRDRPCDLKAMLTPIHPRLAVQYQICVITRLPQVMLIAAILRQDMQPHLTGPSWSDETLATWLVKQIIRKEK